MKQLRRHLIFFLFITNVASFLSIFCATYPFWMGVFFQVNSVLIFIHLLSFVTGSIFCFLLIVKDRLLLSALMSLPSLVLLFFVFWGFIVSFISKASLMSFLGHGAIGEGLLTFINFYVSFVAFLYLFRFSKYKSLITYIFVAVCFVLVLIQLTTDKNSFFRPYWVSEYLGFYALFLAFLPMVSINFRSKLYVFFWLILVGVLLFLSHNKAAFLAIIILAPLYYGFYQFKIIQHIKFSYAFLFVLLIPFLMPFATKIFISIGYFQEHYNYIVSSLYWRDQSNQLIIKDLVARPIGFLIGNGWGHFADLVMNSYQEGIFHGWQKTEMYEINRTTFHSHHLILELLHATGFVGFVLFINFIFTLIVKVQKNLFLSFTCFLVSFLTLSSVWFMVPSIYPLLAAICAGGIKVNYQKWKYEQCVFLSIVIFFSLISFWAIIMRFYLA